MNAPRFYVNGHREVRQFRRGAGDAVIFWIRASRARRFASRLHIEALMLAGLIPPLA